MAIHKFFFPLCAAALSAALLSGCIGGLPGLPDDGTATPTPAWMTPSGNATPAPEATPGRNQCIGDCDDLNPCTADECGPRTGFQCSHVALFGAVQGCAGSNGSSCTDMSCDAGACVTRITSPCCGNGRCEDGEDCTCGDCVCEGSGLCCNGSCLDPVCVTDLECDDSDKCTYDSCGEPNTCGSACVFAPRACIDADGCCGAGCDFVSDNDCYAFGKGENTTDSRKMVIRVDNVIIRNCLLERTGNYEKWVALQLTLKSADGKNKSFARSDFEIYDPYIEKHLAWSVPEGTDCAERDAEYMLTDGNVSAERTGLVYYSYKELLYMQGGKEVTYRDANGSRLVWLIRPSG